MSIKDEVNMVFKTSGIIGLRLFLVSAPVIGSFLDVIATEVFQARRDYFIDTTLHKLDFEKIDKEYLNSLEFQNILIKTVEIATKEIYEEKLEYYSKIIKNSLESEESDRRYNFDYILSLSELSIEQLYILKELYEIQKDTVDGTPGETLQFMIKDDMWQEFILRLEEKYGIKKDDVTFLLKRTESSGLIYEITGAYWDYSGGIYKVDKAFPKLMGKLDIGVQ